MSVIGRTPIDSLEKEAYSKAVSQMVIPMDGSLPTDAILEVTPAVKKSNSKLSRILIAIRSLELHFPDGDPPSSIDMIIRSCEVDNTALNQDIRIIYKDALVGEMNKEPSLLDKSLGRV